MDNTPGLIIVMGESKSFTGLNLLFNVPVGPLLGVTVPVDNTVKTGTYPGSCGGGVGEVGDWGTVPRKEGSLKEFLRGHHIMKPGCNSLNILGTLNNDINERDCYRSFIKRNQNRGPYQHKGNK